MKTRNIHTPPYTCPPRGTPRKELHKLCTAFNQLYKAHNWLNAYELREEFSSKPNRYKDAIAFYSIALPGRIKRLPNRSTLVVQHASGLLCLSTQVNPNGITGPYDIARTYTIQVKYAGEIRQYRHKRTYEGVYARLYVYGRTVEEAIEKFKEAWATDIIPIFYQ